NSSTGSVTQHSQPHPPTLRGNQSVASGSASVAIAGDHQGDINITTGVATEQSDCPATPPRCLPAPLHERLFVGRGEERRKLKRILNTAANGKPGWIALWGMGGVGKTILAVFVANQMRERFAGAQLFFDLQGTTTPISPTQVMEEVIRR